MNAYSWIQLIFYMVVLLALAKPLGTFMAKVYQGEHTFLDSYSAPLSGCSIASQAFTPMKK